MSSRIRQIQFPAALSLCFALGEAAPAASIASAGIPVNAKSASHSAAHTPTHRRKHHKHKHVTRRPVQGERGLTGAQGDPGQRGLTGAQGDPGQQGATGPQGSPGTPGANLAVLGYARVTATGFTVDSASNNITKDNISKIPGAPGYYCIAALKFTPTTATATAAFVGSDVDAGAQVELASADPNFLADTGCWPGTQALVFTHQGSVPKAEPFYVSFS